jgi:CDP-4-dehydro-6-deoxyglucose reductase
MSADILGMYHINLGSVGRFEASDAQTLLEAAGRAKQPWPYSCRTGRCSACRCRVLSGHTQARAPETGLDDEEKAGGWILACVRTPVSDLQLELPEVLGRPLPEARIWPSRIAELHRPSSDVIRVVLRLPPGRNLEFLPGQFVDVIGPQGLRRSYSMARAGVDDGRVELHVRAVEQGAMSHYWFHQAKVGDLLRLQGPHGTFYLRDVAGLDLVFLATGTGIAPIKAMLESLAHADPLQQPRSVTLLWGGRVLQDLYLDGPQLAVGARFLAVLSRAPQSWSGARGHVQDVYLSEKPDLKNVAVYACGSQALVRSARAALLRAGLPPSRYHADAFVSSGAS